MRYESMVYGVRWLTANLFSCYFAMTLRFNLYTIKAPTSNLISKFEFQINLINLIFRVQRHTSPSYSVTVIKIKNGKILLSWQYQ